MLRFILSIGFISLTVISCRTDNTHSQKNKSSLGTITVNVTTTDAAKVAFEEGTLLLHSFQYTDAAEKFKAAQELDPDFAMAYWGEAMTHNHTLWREQNKTDADEILLKLGDTQEARIAKAPTAFEKDLYESVEILYGEGDKHERDVLYSTHMEKLHKKYPNNHEIAAYYALSVLGAVKQGRDFEAYAKGAKIAESIIAENPNHPGALHYLIHSYDDPKNAPRALEAANRYSKVAPDANHALHMPSHIYVAMGMWDEVISSNKAAFAASEKRKTAKNLDTDVLDFHSLKWLMYGHLQKGEFFEAKELVEKMENYCKILPSKKALSHLVMMKGSYFSETENWNDTLSQDNFDYEKLAIQIKSVLHFNQSMIAFTAKDIESIDTQIELLKNSITAAKDEVMTGGASMCGGNYNRSIPTQIHVDRATVILKEMQALKALLKNNDTEFETIMKEAVALEEATSYMYGPPEIVKPSSEMYGEWLVEQKRFEEAKTQFNKVLKRAPKRLIATNYIETISDNT